MQIQTIGENNYKCMVLKEGNLFNQLEKIREENINSFIRENITILDNITAKYIIVFSNRDFVIIT
jgi:hypothetical protein